MDGVSVSAASSATQTQLKVLAFCQLIGLIGSRSRQDNLMWTLARLTLDLSVDTAKKRASPSTKIMQASKEMPQKNLLHNSQVQSLHLDDDLRGKPMGQIKRGKIIILCRCCGSVRSRRGRTPAGYGDSLRLRRTGTRSFMHYTEVKLWFRYMQRFYVFCIYTSARSQGIFVWKQDGLRTFASGQSCKVVFSLKTICCFKLLHFSEHVINTMPPTNRQDFHGRNFGVFEMVGWSALLSAKKNMALL